MIELRPISTLGRNDAAWLKARLHFAVAGLGNPLHKPLGPLFVWNDDEVQPGAGFPMHAHADVEIVTCVIQGTISHGDSLGYVGKTSAGSIQVMSAGTGIRHAEANSDEGVARVFQIWFAPRHLGNQPKWANRVFPALEAGAGLQVLASGYEDDLSVGALFIDTDARVMGATLVAGGKLDHRMGLRSRAYLVSTAGAVSVNGVRAEAGDGIVVSAEENLEISAISDTEIVLVHVDLEVER